MPTTVKNDKGLFSSPATNYLNAEDFEAIKTTLHDKPEWQSWLAEFVAACHLQYHGWSKESYPKRHTYQLSNVPGGFSNETHLWSQTPEELRAIWKRSADLRASMPSFKNLPAHLNEALKSLESALPKKATFERMNGFILTHLEPGWEAVGGEAWAIWMGSARELGYMDDKKRPAGAAAARLFESQAAAERTARAARFGSDRGPAAIVRLVVECEAIVESDPGATCAAPRHQIAQRESREIADSLEEASLDDIRRALGESPSESIPSAEPPPEGSLAGRETGFACWVDSDHGRVDCGFSNIRGDLGPLTGAILKPNAKAASQASGSWRGRASVVQVSCRPVSIDALIGEPQVSALKAAIAWEGQQAAEAALQKQSADALKQRAAALESGAAQPRRRSRSL